MSFKTNLLIFLINTIVIISLVLQSSVITNDNFIQIDEKILSTESIQDIVVEANKSTHWLSKLRTKEFLYESQNTALNNATSMDQIYFRLASVQLLDNNLNNLSAQTKQFWVNQILSFQNTDGGFGQWLFDSSSLSNTLNAIQSLSWLNSIDSINKTSVKSYLDSLRITLTNGYSSNKYDSDSDLYSTYQAVQTYKLLSLAPTNYTDVADVFFRGQNLDSSYVPGNELGGFGAQSNNFKTPPIVWSSEITMTRAAFFGLQILNTTASDQSLILNFVTGLQANSGTDKGAFASDFVLPSFSGAYTSSAIELILNLNSSIFSNNASSVSYLKALEQLDGGFAQTTTSSGSSLRGTYFALLGLTLLNQTPSNVTKTLKYLVDWVPDGLGGFGASPGESASLRETFDGVKALILLNENIADKNAIISYVDSYRNPDGGYGILNSYTESTLRVVEIYNLLNVPFPNPNQTITFLQSLQRIDGGFEKALGKGQSYVISTYRAVKALQILGSQPSNVASAINYIKNLQNPDGGFGGGTVADTSDVTTTYRAVSALNILGGSLSATNTENMLNFIKDSQIADGGFKRSPSDILLPKNVSNMIHTYSAIQTLLLYNEVPINASGVYSFILETRNSDGGFAEHAKFTSDIAYTYSAILLLKNIGKFTNFQLILPQDIFLPRNPSHLLNLTIKGKLLPINVLISNKDTSSIIVNETLTSETSIIINTTSYSNGVYNLTISLTDQSLESVDLDVKITIDNTVSTSTNNNTTNTISSVTQPSNSSITLIPSSNTDIPSDTNKSSDAISFIYFLIFVGSIAVFKLKIKRKIK